MQNQVDVILNATSRRSRALEMRKVIAEGFQAQGVEASIMFARNGKELAAMARRARQSASPTVVAAGGDGTVNAVASALMGTEKSLGVLPVGTFNYFARKLGIPLDLEGAVRNASGRHTAAVDVGELNGRIFINNASIGLYPSIIRQREQEYRRWGRRQLVAYAAVARSIFQRNPFLNVRLTTDGDEQTARTPLIFVACNRYQVEEFDLPGSSCLGRGELAIYVAHPTGLAGLLRLALQALLRRLRGERSLQVICAREASVETRRRRLPVALDGEVVVLETPLRFTMRYGALKVVVPEPAEAESPAASRQPAA